MAHQPRGASSNVATMENTDPDQGVPLTINFNTFNDVVLGGDPVRAHATSSPIRVV